MRIPTSLVVVVVALVFLLAPACGVGAQGYPYGVYQAPPPPHVEVVDARPGSLWVNGAWTRAEGEWHWQGGHYEAARPGEVYVQGRWEKRSKGAWFWTDGIWYTR
jgi:hypothetical protein